MKRRIISLLGIGLLLIGCSGDDGSAGPTPGPAVPGPDWPLLGVPSADQTVDVSGPVLAVKVDNTSRANPQLGLDRADIVVEEPVEGGVTRLAVLIHSDIGGTAGPVRSVRSSDIGIVLPVDAVLVASGGAPEALADLEAAGIETRFEDSPGFFRDDDRVSPFNLFVDVEESFTDIAESRSAAPPTSPVPTPQATSDLPSPGYFDWGEIDVPGAPADGLVLRFSDAQTTEMTFSEGTWQRVLAEPDGFEATTVVALEVEQTLADYLDPSGAPVPISITEGSGRGWIAHDGEVVEVTWSKPEADDTWSFSTVDEQGQQVPVPVPPGRTYVALLPTATGSLEILAPATPTPTG